MLSHALNALFVIMQFYIIHKHIDEYVAFWRDKPITSYPSNTDP